MFGNHANLAPSGLTSMRQTSGNGPVISNISRRGFLGATGGILLNVALAGTARAQDANPLSDVAGGDALPSLWVAIGEDGTVKITCHRSEMGQQTWTAMAQIVADELDAPWENVEIEQALGDARYGDQNTDGSRSVRYNFHRLRVAGAAMRTMLTRVAAETWNVDAQTCVVELGVVTHAESGRQKTYGELASAASTQTVPAEPEVGLKTREQWRYIGQPIPSLTVPRIVRGDSTYGIDVDRPNMVYAVIARPPQVFGKTGAVNDAAARAVPGVLDTVQLPDLEPPALFKALGGVAVVASDTWAAIQGRAALEIKWLDGPNAGASSDTRRAELEATARQPGDVRRNRGDFDAALAAAATRVEAEYYVPHMSQSPLEPPSATAEWTDGKLECWAPVQDPQTARNVLSQVLGVAVEDVTVHATWLGGAFGRKSKPDFVVEAALISREVGRPVKVTWTREDDIRHGYYHAGSAQRFEAGLDADGTCTAFLHRTVFPTISSTFAPGADQPSALEMNLGATDTPFAAPNLRVESGRSNEDLRIGWLRSVCNIQHAFGVQSFADELAHAAGRDPKDYLLELIGEPRTVDPTQEGAEYPNYDASLEVYPIETERLSNVIRLATDMSGWGRDLPEGHGLGIAAHRSFLTYVATIVEIAVDAEGEISIPGVWLAVDAGTVVNPKHVRAQIEGGVLYGLSNALYGDITYTDGAVDQWNFPDWRLMRMEEAPRAFNVEIVASNAPPAGVGEPGTPPAAPALTNAIFAATGQRVRTLPILGADRFRLSRNS
ncbi:MAG: molybdopterin cofactor-binding domain-containing protein [Pseudomonadota bacterium]